LIVRLGVKNIKLLSLIFKIILLTPIVAFLLAAVYLSIPVAFLKSFAALKVGVLSLMAMTLFSTIFIYALLKKFKKSKYGLCNGWEFQKWMREVLTENKADSAQEFNEKTVMSAEEYGLKCKSQNCTIPNSKISLISCDITAENKIEFPKDIHRYGYAKTIRPSNLVRASMSIPFFFKPAAINWTNSYKRMIENDPDKVNYFVDGGMLSNFPMDVFHNSINEEIHMPIVGVNLNEKNNSKIYILSSLFSFLKSMLNTMRFYNDKNFLNSNKFYQKYCIHHIDTSGFNWLDFNMSNRNKFYLFRRGVQAGVEFLESFDWEKYKKAHASYFEIPDEVDNPKLAVYGDIVYG